jgi:hypothetical protein
MILLALQIKVKELPGNKLVEKIVSLFAWLTGIIRNLSIIWISLKDSMFFWFFLIR